MPDFWPSCGYRLLIAGADRRLTLTDEFLRSLRTAEILRRPKSLAYLQSLKWMAQVKERVR